MTVMNVRSLSLPALVAILCSSCIGFYDYRPIEITVTDHATGAHVAGAPVGVRYASTLILNRPRAEDGVTDETGRVVLPIADWGSTHIQAASTRWWLQTDGFPVGTFSCTEAWHMPDNDRLAGTPRRLPLGDPDDPKVDIELRLESRPD